jgi:tRNA (cytidine/uridine-2'-O-)-methyltransferase
MRIAPIALLLLAGCVNTVDLARATRPYTAVAFERGDVLVFGSESKGLPDPLKAAHAESLLAIPSRPQVRSLNLSNAVAIAAYEALRQWAM